MLDFSYGNKRLILSRCGPGGGTRHLHHKNIKGGSNRIDVRVNSQKLCPEWYQRYRTKIINANDNEMALAA